MEAFSEKALALTLKAEGLDQPGSWPGGFSGITIGIGYDLGYATVDQFESDWAALLPANSRERLKEAVGLRGIKAKNAAPRYTSIRIKRRDAEECRTIVPSGEAGQEV